MTDVRLLIVGAGPTGLTAAIEAARLGIIPIVFDRNPGPTERSRAVGVNRASLKLLQSSGATRKILANAEPLRNARMFDGNRQIARLAVPQPASGPPSMVALPQSETEAILVETLHQHGHSVRWNTRVDALAQDAGGVVAHLENGEGVTGDYVLGADGSRSTVRGSLELSFEGPQYEGTWSLADIEVDWPFPDDQAAAWLNKDGSVLFVITLGKGRFRAISNRADAVERAAERMVVRRVLLQDTFTVSLKRVDRFGEGRIWIAGDAGHIHSPVGGMGMNLGIEDACDFVSTLIEADGATPDFDGYNRRRIEAAKRVMSVSDRGYRTATLTSPFARWLRNSAIFGVGNLGFIRRALARLVFRMGA